MVLSLFFSATCQPKHNPYTIPDSEWNKAIVFAQLFHYLNPTQYCAIAQRGSKADDGIADTVFYSTDALYSTGYASGAINGESRVGASDFFIAKHDLAGNLSWIKQFGSALNDYGFSLAIDTKNTLYVGGAVQGSIDGNVYAGNLDGNTNAGGYDILLAKYDTSGQKLFVRLYGTANNDYGFSLSNGLNKNIFISGQTDGAFAGYTSKGKFDMFVMPLTTNGNCFLTK